MNSALTNLGLTPFFTMQLSAQDIGQSRLVRIVEVQRSLVITSDGVNEWPISLGSKWQQLPADQRPTIGDWVLVDEPRQKIVRLLERKSIFKRLATGTRVDVQLIAANVDTLFIVSSCNDEFNESRLERYLVLALEAGVYPVVVLTKADLAEEPEVRVYALRGGLLLDVPGMRELKVAELDTSLAEVFSEVEAFAVNCKFRNCEHNDEPGCAVRQAIDSGEIDERRFSNYQKLVREETRNTASLADQRHQDRQFGKTIKQYLELKRQSGRKHQPS